MNAAAAVLGVAAVTLAITEAAMRPSPQERLTLYGGFAAAALIAALGRWWLSRVHRHLASLRWTILVVAVAAVATTVVVVGVSARTMLLSPADVRLVLAALLLGTGLGVITALGVAGPLTVDLRHLTATARRVADGDLSVRTGIERRDEVGELARSVDRMVRQLDRLAAERASGEAARRRLLASIGHDLRTPLASLRAALEAIEDGVAPDPERYLRAMAGDVERLAGMVDDLFVLARLEAGDVDLERLPIDLTELADGAVEAASSLAARRDIAIELTADGPARAVGDPRALDRVLRNLLDNAIRHAPAESTVDVLVGADGPAWTIRVHDAGPGFPPEFVAQAFDRSSRVDTARERHGGGAGLGLAIAKELVDAHGGRIWIETGAGATVAVRLPTGEPHPVAGDRRDISVELPVSRS